MVNSPSRRCVINFGLYPGRRVLGADSKVFATLREYWLAVPELLGVNVTRELVIPASEAAEPTLIAAGELIPDYAAYQSLTALLAKTEQDCCAILFPDLGRGRLFGPGAHRWGTFDFDAFHLPGGYDYDPFW